MKRHKYPRTFHLPWSEGATSDDKTLDNVDHFEGKRVIITENSTEKTLHSIETTFTQEVLTLPPTSHDLGCKTFIVR